MTRNRDGASSFVVVGLDRVSQGVARVEAILDSLGIPFEVIDGAHQRRGATAMVLRVPEDRIADAMLALELKGFSEVMAYHSGDTERRAS